MSNFNQFIITIFVSILLIGCVPFPTKNTIIPNISGSIAKNNIGLSDYVVKLAYGTNDSCLSSDAISAKTDKNGNFKFNSTHGWSMIRWVVPIHGIDYFTLCFTSPEGLNKWAYISHLRSPSWIPDISLFCKESDLFSSPQKIELGHAVMSTCVIK